MGLIKNFQDFRTSNSKSKEQEVELPHRKSSDEIKPERRTDDKSHQSPSSAVTIPGWKNY